MKCYMRSKDMTTGTGPQLGRPQPNPLCHLECKLHLRGVPTQGKGTGFSETLIHNRHCLLAVRVSQAFLSSASTGKTAPAAPGQFSEDKPQPLKTLPSEKT